MVFMSPPCATFSRATWANFSGPRPVRSFTKPRGEEVLTAKERDRAIAGNIFADFCWDIAKLGAQGKASFLVLEKPEDLGAMTAGPHKGERPASMWQWPQHVECIRLGLVSAAFHRDHLAPGDPKPTRLLLKTTLGLPDFVAVGPPTFDAAGYYYAGPLPARTPPLRSTSAWWLNHPRRRGLLHFVSGYQ